MLVLFLGSIISYTNFQAIAKCRLQSPGSAPLQDLCAVLHSLPYSEAVSSVDSQTNHLLLNPFFRLFFHLRRTLLSTFEATFRS